MGCGASLGAWALLLALHLVLVGQPVNAAGWKCNTIYKGFAECLVSLGDSMAQNVQKDMEDDTIQDQEELNTICSHASHMTVEMSSEALALRLCNGDEHRPLEPQTTSTSWDDFHACATKVLSNCPEEAANIWESLRQESRKIQFQGNLHDLCSTRAQLAGDGKALRMDETNQETLRGAASLLWPSLMGRLTLVALVALVPFA